MMRVNMPPCGARYAGARSRGWRPSATPSSPSRPPCSLFAAVGLVSVLTAVTGFGVRFGGPGWVYFLVGPLCWAHSVWSARRTPEVFAS